MDYKNVLKYLKKNFLVSLGKNVSGIATTLILLPIVIARLGVENYGIISLTLLFSGVSSIADLGLSKTIVTLIGSRKVHENRIITAAAIINVILICAVLCFFIISQLLSVRLLGEDLNISFGEETLLIYTSLLILILSVSNNLARSILEAKYFLHIVSLTFAIYNPLLYGILILVSFFTLNIKILMLIPLILSVITLMFYIFFIKKHTSLSFVKVKVVHIKYMFKNALGFLNLGLVNSLVNPSLRYFFVLNVSDVLLYGILDIAFKIALSINGLIASIATPMLAVFSNSKREENNRLVKLSYKIFILSIIILSAILIAYFFFGNYFISYLNVDSVYRNLLYELSYLLLFSIGFMSSVEIFARYFMGNKMINKIFLLKLIIPVFGVFCYFLLFKLSSPHRIISAYSCSLIISSIAIIIAFHINSKKTTSL